MNEKQRLDTKTLLANTLSDLLDKKAFQKITVNELCETAGIGRSTFYLHFEDKYQLLAFSLNEMANTLEKVMEHHAPKEFFTTVLETIQKSEKKLYHVFEAELNAELVNMFYHYFSRYITQCLQEKVTQGCLRLQITERYFINTYWVLSAITIVS